MSYALETKKRKFHRVLESLTKPSNTETSQTPRTSTALDHAPSTKRARLLPASVRKDVLKLARPASRASSVSSQSRPSFNPWDREGFLERLETFRRVDRWSPKPSAVNEVEWSKRGWICTDVARVTCVGGCGGSVVVKIPDELDELDGYDADKIQERKEVRAKLVQEYAHLMVQGHGENCAWRNKGCDATIHRLPLTNPDVAISNLKTRYSHLVQMADQLPSPDTLQVPEGFNTEDIISTLPDGALSTTETSQSDVEGQNAAPERNEDTPAPSAQDDTPLNQTAFILAFLGWDSVDGASNLAGCRACFRRLGLWMYKPKSGGSPADDLLDAANEHMDYCPWVNGRAQSGTGRPSEKTEGLHCGWELLKQALRVKHLRHIQYNTPVASRAGSEALSTDDPVIDESTDDKKAKDREWWAKIRRMKQMLNVKSPKNKSSATK